MFDGYSPTQLFIRIVDPTATAFSDTSLPETLDLNDFDFPGPFSSRIDIAQFTQNSIIFELTGFTSTSTRIDPDPDPMAPIPLPASVWLMLAGVGALGVTQRRRAA